MLVDLLTVLEGKPCRLESALINHLEWLLNTRKGSMTHLPQYGLNLNPSYEREGAWEAPIQQSLRALIERYEPRITGVHFHKVEGMGQDYVLKLTLSAEMDGVDAIRLDALLLNYGGIRLTRLA